MLMSFFGQALNNKHSQPASEVDFACDPQQGSRLSRKKVWMPRFALSLGDRLLIYRIDCRFNFFEIASAHFVGNTHTYSQFLTLFSCLIFFL